ncbi:Uncharacterised protein [Mycobacteroides abscessus subsp. abscessus]|nr:Uncharacterised protein [Mycobacteroides abscessus subsp. abscessus]
MQIGHVRQVRTAGEPGQVLGAELLVGGEAEEVEARRPEWHTESDRDQTGDARRRQQCDQPSRFAVAVQQCRDHQDRHGHHLARRGQRAGHIRRVERGPLHRVDGLETDECHDRPDDHRDDQVDQGADMAIHSTLWGRSNLRTGVVGGRALR